MKYRADITGEEYAAMEEGYEQGQEASAHRYETTIEGLAHLVQHHVPVQPWSGFGNSPVPVDMWYADGKWSVKFVLGLNSTGSKRRWAYVNGAETLEAALRQARSQQHRDARKSRET